MLGRRIVLQPLCYAAALMIAQSVLFVSSARATEPQLRNVLPQGGQRGTTVEVQLTGRRLGDVEEILFDEPGITVAELKSSKDNRIEAKLTIAADCRLGAHPLWVRTAGGVSNLFTFHVGALPEISEKEPNSEFESPQKIDFGTVVNGVVENEDVDYFAIEVKKGERINCEIEALRLGRTFFDPYIAILDAKRFELVRSDDSALLRQDGVCGVVAPEDGRYIVVVRESAYQGNGNCHYRLHVGRFPRPKAVYPAGGKPGQTLQVRWIGDPAGEWSEQVTLPPDARDGFGLLAQDDRGVAPSLNQFRLVDLDNVLETEPNNGRDAANSATAPGALNGIIQAAGDQDWFKLSMKKGQQFDVRVYARSVRTPLDSVLYIYDAKGRRLAGNDDDRGEPDSYLRFKVPADGDYFVMIRDHLDSGDEHYVYRIEVTPVEPELTLSISEFRRYVASMPEIPRGNRTALLVRAARRNFGGELKIEMPELPKGVTLETVPMPANRSNIPVVLSAAADAPLSGVVAPLLARTTDEKVNITGRLNQQHWLVRGQNNRDVWSYWADRLPTVVTEEVPFSIKVVEPKVPLVQKGQMNLKVVATRKEGFDAPIRVRLLDNPPGVSSSGNVSIDKGKTEAVIPLTANDKAATDPAPIVVVATADVEGGTVRICSQIVPLEIATPYLAFDFKKAAVEQGKETKMLIDVEVLKEFPGKAKVELLGLPAGVTTETLEIDKDATELQFPLKVADDARPGRHKSIVCRAIITIDGELISHTLGTGELRVDEPIEPKKETAKKAEKPKPKAAAKKEEAKPLSRLEKLRLERKQELQK
jgi:hypothetical protein